ncbi:MAG: nicotinate-nucleotide adenylyltransferase [Tissierellia bacterium]|nr:nicotinate-nucleotide adenylyltransferase [Tissierellia bacterium]
MDQKKIGIMGGTFDPIHNGHLILAEHSRINFGLDEVLFIPTGNPPHKDEDGISSDIHRYNMTLLAIETNPYFNISTMEMERQGNTYTIDTIRQLQEEYPSVDFYFILGSDSFSNIDRWKDYMKLVTLCEFIILKRSGTGEDGELDMRVREFNRRYNSSFHILNAPNIEISSTGIRNNIGMGLSIKYLVPEGVEAYIERERLYEG